LESAVREEVWRIPQLNEVVREFRRSEKIIATDYKGAFSRKADPLLSLNDDE
jgi:hypothetical protein